MRLKKQQGSQITQGCTGTCKIFDFRWNEVTAGFLL